VVMNVTILMAIVLFHCKPLVFILLVALGGY
jgi:hypothetical protein